MWDVTNGVSDFLYMFINGIGNCFNILERIQLGDTNLLKVSITFFILSIIIPILFTVLAARSTDFLSYGSNNEASKRNQAKQEQYYKPDPNKKFNDGGYHGK